MAKDLLSIDPREFIWAQKYRPQTVKDMILPKNIKNKILRTIKKKEIPNYILVGVQGSGKTTAAKAIAHDLGSEVLFINASLENGIDLIRNKITTFISTMSLADAPKVVILDEADHLTTNAQASLRSLIEQYSKNARFILTANYASKIIAPLHSRCEVIDFGSLINNEETKKEMFVEIYNRVLKIFELEGVKFDTKDPKEAQVIFEVIKKEYPDIRSVLKILQSYTTGGELDAGNSVDSYNHLLNEIVELIKEAKYTEIRKWLGTHTDIDSITLMRHLYDTLYDQLADQSKPELVLILAKYMYQDAFVVDKVINTMACITEIFLNCNFVE